MKYLKLLLPILIVCQALSTFAQTSTKVKDLPTTTTGTNGDFLIKDYYTGVSGSTQKITVSNFLSLYNLLTYGDTSANIASMYYVLAHDTTQLNGYGLLRTNSGEKNTFSVDSSKLQTKYNSSVTYVPYSGANASINANNQIIYNVNDLTLGYPHSNTGTLSFANGSNYYVASITGGINTQTYILTLPTSQGSSGQTLQNNGSGVLSWVTPTTSIGDSGVASGYGIRVTAASPRVVKSDTTIITSKNYLISKLYPYIKLTSLSASSPLSYNNTTGAFIISQSNTSTNGYLSSTDWNTFNGKQAAYTNLSSIGSLSNTAGYLYNNGSGSFSYTTPTGYSIGYATLTVSSGAVTFNANSYNYQQDSLTSSATTYTVSFSGFNAGTTCLVDYFKTTASNCAITFPANCLISVASGMAVSGTYPSAQTVTAVSTTSGEFTIQVVRVDPNSSKARYHVYITQDQP